MDIWLTYAYILNGEVKNIASYLYSGYTEANVDAVSIYGSEAFAVDVTHIPVHIGDTYTDGSFCRDGEEVQRLTDDGQEATLV